MSNNNDQGGGRINVSEDRMRRVIAEFENSLREFIDEKLESKADLYVVQGLERHIGQLDEAMKERTKVRDKEVDARLANLERWRYGLTLLFTATVIVAGLVAKFHIFG